MVDEDRAEGIGHNVRGKLQDAVGGPSRCRVRISGSPLTYWPLHDI